MRMYPVLITNSLFCALISVLSVESALETLFNYILLVAQCVGFTYVKDKSWKAKLGGTVSLLYLRSDKAVDLFKLCLAFLTSDSGLSSVVALYDADCFVCFILHLSERP